MRQDHEHVFGAISETDRHESYLLETSLSGGRNGTGWVAGLAFQSERFSSETFAAFNYDYDVPGAFVEIDQDLGDRTSLALSARWDDHSEYGSQLSPRLALLHRPGNWTLRASYGQGYFAPTPFVEEIEASGLSRLEPLSGLREETAQTASIDIGYQRDVLEANLTVFASKVDRVTGLVPFASAPGGQLNRVRLVNAQGATRIRGSEVLLRYFWSDFKLTASYLYLDATEQNPQTGARRDVALTPEHSAGFVAMWEQHGRGRLGFEAYYTGIQRLDDNPYREESEPYWHLGLLGEITVGRISWFINLENLLDVRQTKDDPLLLPTRSPQGQWTTDIWSRNDGFIVNGGFRMRFGG
jgi:outer membrane cobalamin receptor